MRFGSYLLAAGQGRRAGGPKAWLAHEGLPLIERQAVFLLGFLPPERIAVSIQEGWGERCRAIHPDVRWIPVDPEAPPLAALQALLRAAPPEGWCFLHHVDMPVWERALFKELERASSRAEEAVIPMVAGRGGHPVLLSPKLAAKIEALDPSKDRLDRWLRSRKALRFEVPFACAVENWNVGVSNVHR
ncbi:MAG: nucleotidyltransferase family protein [Elusimicrobia bacterium]|nr:nucleotidyltransferase family protein [Elusimicrobiota bacterium]